MNFNCAFFFLRQESKDVSFQCVDHSWEQPPVKAHKCLLMAASPYFAAMLHPGKWLESSTLEPISVHHSTDVMLAVITWIYTDKYDKVCIQTRCHPFALLSCEQ
jgi:hypothetical protein